MKARTRFAVLILAITLVLGGVVYGQVELAKDRSVDRMRENVDLTADRTARQIDAQVRHKKNYVGFYASRPEASNFSRSDRFLAELLTNPHVFAGQVVAPNGSVVASRGDVELGIRRTVVTSRSDIALGIRREATGTESDVRQYVQRTAQTGEITVTDPVRVNGSDQYVVVVNAPIFEDGEIVGVLAAGVPINEFTFLPMLRSLETEMRAVSVTADGRVLHGPHRSFEDAVASTATVESTGWTVRVSRDRSALNARLREMAVVQIASLALVLSLIVGFAVWEYNANIRQIEKLLDGFRALRDGEYDYTPDLSSGDEWNQIREGFDELATALSDRETRLEESRQRLQVFNRVLRHNLRNDLTVVVNYAEFVAEQSDDPAVREAAEKIAAHGWDLVDTSEKANRIERSMRDEDPEPTPVDVTSVVTDAADAVASDHPEAEVSVDAPDELYGRAISALPAAVENVCENAVEHNDEADPTVSVSVETVTDDGEEWVRVAVTDDGPGIPDHERTVLLEGEETDLEHGSGLGLWLVHWVVERSGGRLSFAENDPSGSVVRIDLPLAGGED